MEMENLSSNMQRYFVSGSSENIIFPEKDIFHIKKVMRNKVGDQIEIVLSDKAYLATIDKLEPLHVYINEPILKEAELENDLTIFFPLTKSDKAELVIQKASEIGASKVVFYRSKRCVIKLDQESFNKKKERYLAIAKEASEQCHRLKIVDICGVINLQDIDNYLLDRNYVAYELEAGNTSPLYEELSKDNKSTSIIVGPEGGFEKEEISLLVNKGFKVVSLGKRILRCETAAIYALSVISFMMEK